VSPLKVVHRLFLTCVLAFPLTLSAQSRGAAPATPGKAQTDEQLRGDAFFQKTCFLCHNPTGQTTELKIAVTNLAGLFKRPGVTEEYVRQRIQEGIPGRMPAYKYTYTPAQLDNIIAYLKIR
jgi:mono/diheme cytochrome c family protein